MYSGSGSGGGGALGGFPLPIETWCVRVTFFAEGLVSITFTKPFIPLRFGAMDQERRMALLVVSCCCHLPTDITYVYTL